MRKSIEKRFFGKVGPLSFTTLCMQWTGATNHDGYGIIAIKGETIRYAHRVSWELHYGQIPQGMNVLHSCDNRPCVRPDHLFIGAQVDNIRDMMDKGRDKHCPGESNGRAKLTDEKVIEIIGLLKAGHKHQTIADRFGCSEPSIWQIAHKRTWKHITVQG